MQFMKYVFSAWTARLRAGHLLMALALGPVLNAAHAAPRTVLEYTALDATAVVASPEVPETAFHAWSVSDQEAAAIVESWKTMPVTVPWTRIQLARYVKHKMMPTRGARGLALVHTAMHDALLLSKELKADSRLAVSMAAAQVLAYLFPAEERAFDRIAFSLAARLTGAPREQLPAAARSAMAIGKAVGERVVAYGEADGAQRGWNGIRLQWYGEGRYYGPGSWEPTAPYFYYPPDEPFALGWKTWVLKEASQFRPVPPTFMSPRYLADLREVVEINKNLTPEQLAIARFWVDGHGSVTPPGHWNQIAIDELGKHPRDDETTARLFMQLNIAMADVFVAIWDAKYFYWTLRPVTAAKNVLGVTFKPAILTPPFPSYGSGHAGFSGAGSAITAQYFPEDGPALKAMGEQAALSRLLGGIHFRHDNEDGLALGRRIADAVLRHFSELPSP